MSVRNEFYLGQWKLFSFMEDGHAYFAFDTDPAEWEGSDVENGERCHPTRRIALHIANGVHSGGVVRLEVADRIYDGSSSFDLSVRGVTIDCTLERSGGWFLTTFAMPPEARWKTGYRGKVEHDLACRAIEEFLRSDRRIRSLAWGYGWRGRLLRRWRR